MAETTTYRNALPAGAMLFEYRLESVLGAGAFGMTYLACDTHLDKQVAIKEYLPTELAVRTAQAAGLALAGFARREDFVAYTAPERFGLTTISTN